MDNGQFSFMRILEKEIDKLIENNGEIPYNEETERLSKEDNDYY